MQFNEAGDRKCKCRYGDEDELELEKQRKRRQMPSKEFKLFLEKIAEAAIASVDPIPRPHPLVLTETRELSDLGARMGWTFLSASCRRRASVSEYRPDYNRQPTA